MAMKVRRVKIYLGMSSKQISKMSDKELRQAVTILNSAANKRIKRVYREGLSSAKIDEQLKKGKFSVAGIKSRAALENSFVDVYGFLKASTTSVRGIRSAQDKTFRNLAELVNPELSDKEQINVDTIDTTSDQELKDIIDLVWTQVDKLSEDKKLGITKRERYAIAAHAYNVTTRNRRPIKTKAGLFKNLKKFYKQNYKKSITDTELENLTPEEEKVAAEYSNFT